jgi:hypothetical protein
VIAFDIDGVLADAGHREHHLGSRPKDWTAFFDAAAQDEVIEAGRTALLQAWRHDQVVLVSGRPERLRTLTQVWLARHGFPSLDIHLRADGDHRPAQVVKSEILAALGGPAVVTRVHEDDPKVMMVLVQHGYQVVLADPTESCDDAASAPES